jgi:hypothetical protein
MAGTAEDGGPVEAAQFVARAAGELAQLARQHRLDILAYLLDMAQLEAQEIARRPTSDKL